MISENVYQSIIPYTLLCHSLDFCVTHNVLTTCSLTRVASNPPPLKKLINETNLLFESQVQQATSAIIVNGKTIRRIIISGLSVISQ